MSKHEGRRRYAQISSRNLFKCVSHCFKFKLKLGFTQMISIYYDLSLLGLQFIDDKASQNDQIFADLTIRGITHVINFPLVISQTKLNYYAEGSIDINRTLFNIKYNSGTFFEELGDRMIYDDFTVQFSLQTKVIQHK